MCRVKLVRGAEREKREKEIRRGCSVLLSNISARSVSLKGEGTNCMSLEKEQLLPEVEGAMLAWKSATAGSDAFLQGKSLIRDN